MEYKNVREGRFVARRNRFVAEVELDGAILPVHVKNTGRLRELFLPGARVVLSKSDAPGRATAYDLIAVWREGRLFHVDSQAPNRLFAEWLRAGGLGAVENVRPEVRYGGSRLDFSFTLGGKACLAEVKGVTLCRDGGFYFPDAPTDRGIRHLGELARAVEEGYACYAVFVAQAEGAKFVSPNPDRPEFAAALRAAAAAGVRPIAFDCRVEPGRVIPRGEIPVIL
ncbi:MAG: DNA/RNA nuclease SfsA [Clostridia bacterium]|nr:DNA/RNA nuclease SfsA [Clostridia bacterium]